MSESEKVPFIYTKTPQWESPIKLREGSRMTEFLHDEKERHVTPISEFDNAAIEPRCSVCGKELMDDIEWGFKALDGLPAHFTCVILEAERGRRNR